MASAAARRRQRARPLQRSPSGARSHSAPSQPSPRPCSCPTLGGAGASSLRVGAPRVLVLISPLHRRLLQPLRKSCMCAPSSPPRPSPGRWMARTTEAKRMATAAGAALSCPQPSRSQRVSRSTPTLTPFPWARHVAARCRGWWASSSSRAAVRRSLTSRRTRISECDENHLKKVPEVTLCVLSSQSVMCLARRNASLQHIKVLKVLK